MSTLFNLTSSLREALEGAGSEVDSENQGTADSIDEGILRQRKRRMLGSERAEARARMKRTKGKRKLKTKIRKKKPLWKFMQGRRKKDLQGKNIPGGRIQLRSKFTYGSVMAKKRARLNNVE